MNSSWSNVKLRDLLSLGSLNKENIKEEIKDNKRGGNYPWKAHETRNPMKPKSSDSDLRSERYPCLKMNKNPSLKLGER